MKKKWTLLLIICLGMLCISYFGITQFLLREQSSRTTVHFKDSYGPYFVPVSISKFTDVGIPCLNAEIEDKVVSLKLDLGFQGELGVWGSFIDQIPSKTFLYTQAIGGFRGIKHENNVYKIPKITIGAMSFYQPELQEESDQFLNECVINEENAEPSPHEPGRIGWEFFRNFNLFLDLKNSRVAFCNSLDPLSQYGYEISKFIKAPLLIERGLIEVEAKTAEGPLRCMLDTGATWNVLNTELEAGKTIEQAALDPENILQNASFHIGESDFGALAFHRFPLKFPIHVDAILGMEFFQDHIVFIDFSENCIYFQKASELPKVAVDAEHPSEVKEG